MGQRHQARPQCFVHTARLLSGAAWLPAPLAMCASVNWRLWVSGACLLSSGGPPPPPPCQGPALPSGPNTTQRPLTLTMCLDQTVTEIVVGLGLWCSREGHQGACVLTGPSYIPHPRHSSTTSSSTWMSAGHLPPAAQLVLDSGPRAPSVLALRSVPPATTARNRGAAFVSLCPHQLGQRALLDAATPRLSCQS